MLRVIIYKERFRYLYMHTYKDIVSCQGMKANQLYDASDNVETNELYSIAAMFDGHYFLEIRSIIHTVGNLAPWDKNRPSMQIMVEKATAIAIIVRWNRVPTSSTVTISAPISERLGSTTWVPSEGMMALHAKLSATVYVEVPAISHP